MATRDLTEQFLKQRSYFVSQVVDGEGKVPVVKKLKSGIRSNTNKLIKSGDLILDDEDVSDQQKGIVKSLKNEGMNSFDQYDDAVVDFDMSDSDEENDTEIEKAALLSKSSKVDTGDVYDMNHSVLTNRKTKKEFSHTNETIVDIEMENMEHKEESFVKSPTEDIIVTHCVSLLEETRRYFKSVKNKLMQLEKWHQQHTRHYIGKDELSEERKIEKLTKDIGKLFKRCQENIKMIDVDAQNLENQRDLFCINVKKSLVSEMDELTNQFRKQQKEYFDKLTALKMKKKELRPIDQSFLGVNVGNIELNEDLNDDDKERMRDLENKIIDDPNMTEEQIELVLNNEVDIIKRDKEIKDILKSIVELNEIMHEMRSLVVDQGTILDRIDANLETTHIHVKKAHKDLVVAKDRQRKSSVLMCFGILLLIIAALFVFVVLRFALAIAFPLL